MNDTPETAAPAAAKRTRKAATNGTKSKSRQAKLHTWAVIKDGTVLALVPELTAPAAIAKVAGNYSARKVDTHEALVLARQDGVKVYDKDGNLPE